MDSYKSFAQLRQHEREDTDYRILYREADSKFAVLAPHGGGIEPGTADIADAIAGCDHTFYAFKGLKKRGNTILHITSNAFDESLGVKASQNAQIAITIHGSKDKTETVQIGGRNQHLKQEIMSALRAAGFNAAISDMPTLRGIKPENICNRCRSRQGVQLEISRGLREKMFKNFNARQFRNKTKLFYNFVDTLRHVLSTTPCP
jgi:phage replication-related protein YjqB (UPF0714/DUF867 family)